MNHTTDHLRTIANMLVDDRPVLAEEIEGTLDHIDALAKENERLRSLLGQFIWKKDDCWYDHDGNCQAHNLHQQPCPPP